MVVKIFQSVTINFEKIVFIPISFINVGKVNEFMGHPDYMINIFVISNEEKIIASERSMYMKKYFFDYAKNE